jgi:uncharacterized damage-inducible protein DinB
MTKIYRKGAVGALMDEYERAVLELRGIVETTSESDYDKIFDAATTNEDCRSIQTIMSHVIRACYGYANTIRVVFSIEKQVYELKQLSKSEVLEKLDEAMQYTVETLEDRWEMPDEEIFATSMKGDYPEDLEQKLEHAIVHILRHRRQIDKFLATKLN